MKIFLFLSFIFTTGCALTAQDGENNGLIVSYYNPVNLPQLEQDNQSASSGQSKEQTDTEEEYESGIASWYGGKFHGRRTANGEIYDMHTLTAAHKTLSFGTMVRVTNLLNKKTVVVRINDRGPFVEGRIIDLSHAAAMELDMVNLGVAEVIVEQLGFATEEQKDYFLQIGAFANLENAQALQSQAENNGIAAIVEKRESQTTPFLVIVPIEAQRQTQAEQQLLAADINDWFLFTRERNPNYDGGV